MKRKVLILILTFLLLLALAYAETKVGAPQCGAGKGPWTIENVKRIALGDGKGVYVLVSNTDPSGFKKGKLLYTARLYPYDPKKTPPTTEPLFMRSGSILYLVEAKHQKWYKLFTLPKSGWCIINLNHYDALGEYKDFNDFILIVH